MNLRLHKPSARRWPFPASLPAQQNPAARSLAAPGAGGSGETPTHVVEAFRRANPQLAAALDLLRAQA